MYKESKERRGRPVPMPPCEEIAGLDIVSSSAVAPLTTRRKTARFGLAVNHDSMTSKADRKGSIVRKVLIVDSAAADRDILESNLQAATDLTTLVCDSGQRALDEMEADLPDAVLTALAMPGMDGVEFVRHVHRLFSSVPVILLVDERSQALAHKALRAGAVTYIAKADLSRSLVPTLENVLALALSSSSDVRLNQKFTQTEMQLRLDNDPELIAPLVDMVQKRVAGIFHCDPATRMRIGLALEEALLNALYHGNLQVGAEETARARKSLLDPQCIPLARSRRSQSPFSQRGIDVRIEISQKKLRFVIRDDGPGFDHAAAMVALDATDLDRAGGRGLNLIQSCMDQVEFNRAGNEIRLTKRYSQSREPHLRHDQLQLFDVKISKDTLLLIPKSSISSLIDARVRRELRYVLRSIEDTEVKNVIVDFENVKYFGSSMLEALRLVALQVQRVNGALAACNLSPVSQEILKLTQYTAVWPVEDSRQAAVQRVSGERSAD